MALKRIDIQTPEEGLPPTLLREIALLKSLAGLGPHANIVQLLDISYIRRDESDAPSGVYLIFELFETDLHRLLHSPTESAARPLVACDQRHLMRQLLDAVGFLHCHSIAHRDLKPSNLLICPRTLRLKVADFGLSRTISSTCPLTNTVLKSVLYSVMTMSG